MGRNPEYYFELGSDRFKKVVLEELQLSIELECCVYDDLGIIVGTSNAVFLKSDVLNVVEVKHGLIVKTKEKDVFI